MFVLALLIVTASLRAQRSTTFQVSLAFEALKSDEKVLLMGDAPELGKWRKGVELKSLGSTLYSGNVDWKKSRNKDSVLYKYVILQPDGVIRWEEGGNRVLVVERSSSVVLEPAVFSNRKDVGIRRPVHTVVFSVDASTLFVNGEPVESLYLAGGMQPLQWNTESALELNETAPGIFTARVGFPYGTTTVVPFKILIDVEGEKEWEYLPGHTNHVVELDESQFEQPANLFWDVERGRFVGAGDRIDNIAGLAEKPEMSDWLYADAIRLLELGHDQKAWKQYLRWVKLHPGGAEVDDFLYLWADRLHAVNPVESERFIKQQIKKEKQSYRRLHFTYLMGEHAMHRGDHVVARRIFKQVLGTEQSPDTLLRDVYNYASMGLVVSYTGEEDPDSLRMVDVYVQPLLTSTQPIMWRKKALKQWANKHAMQADFDKQAETLKRASKLSHGRGKAAVLEKLAEAYEQAGMDGEAEQALRELNTVLPEKQVKLRIGLSKLQKLVRAKHYVEASTLLQDLELNTSLNRKQQKKLIALKQELNNVSK
jgi:tetratricopeptide (TPR) repeat protein